MVFLGALCVLNNSIANAQNRHSTTEITLSSEQISSIRYPAVSKTGNFILAWPDQMRFSWNGYVLEELQQNGTWKAIHYAGGSNVRLAYNNSPTDGGLTFAQTGGSIFVVEGKAPGRYQYRLFRSRTDQDIDEDSDDYENGIDVYDHTYYFEPTIEVIVIDGSQ